MTLGGQPGDVLEMVMREGAVLIALGLAGGWAGAALVGRTLESVPAVVSPSDPWVFGAAAGSAA